ncbi:MAG: molybdopterin-dependent oxidoreductase [Burkholderiales bacterium]
MIQRFPQLSHWGAFTAVVEDGVLTACEPFARDPNPSPLLASIPASVYSDLRIRAPMVRKSWLRDRVGSDRTLRGHDEFVEVGWDEALRLVAEEIQRVHAQHGPQGIFAGSYGWSSAGRLHHARSQVRRFYFSTGGAVDQAGNYSWGTAQFLLPHVIGTYSSLTGRSTAWPSIIEHCEIFVAFGGLALKNGQVSSGGAAEHTQEVWLRQLAARGIPVVNVSPTRADAPDFLKAEWLPIRPNTDVALMLALAHEVIAAGAHAQDFLDRCCTGFEVLSAYILGRSDGVVKNPAWAAPITGIDAQRIAGLARKLIGKRSYLTCAFSVQRAHRGEQPYWMVIALAAILGHIGLPGGGFGFGHGSMNGVGNPRPATPGPELPVPNNPLELSIPVARIADMLLNPGAEYRFEGGTHAYPDIRMVHWAGGNPFHHHQQINRFLSAWQRPETIVVNEIWWTPTASYADIVLPATTGLERNDIGGSSRDRYVLAMHQAIKPLHQARNDFDIFGELAQRLGRNEAFTEGRDEAAWIRAIYERCAAVHRRQGIEFPDFESFWNKGYVELPLPESDFVLMEDFRREPQTHPLKTPSGRIELYSERIAAMTGIDMPGHPAWLAPVEWLGAAEATHHPLHLITVQPADRLHSQLDMSPLAQGNKIAGVERVTLNPAEAAKRGLQAGDRVKIYNGRGACYAGLALDDGVMPGVAVMATGAWWDPAEDKTDRAGTANVLTLDIGTSELTQGPNAMSCLVEIAAA